MKSVLILGVEDSPGVIAAESFRKKNFKVIVGCHMRLCTTFFSRYPNKRVLYPSPDMEPDGFIKWLHDFIDYEKIDVIIPIGACITRLLSEHKMAFIKKVKMYLVDFNIYLKALDKAQTMKIAMENGITCPKTYFPAEENLDRIIEMIESYPVVIKPRFGVAARGVTIINSEGELRTKFPEVQRYHGKCIIQEYIPHDGMQYKAEILMNEQQEVISWIVYNKPRHYPAEAGSSTINCTVDREDILKISEEMLRHMDWYGMGDCDFIEDPRDRIPKLMEINPRFTRSIKIASIAGVDFFYKVYQLAMGEKVKPDKKYKTGQYLRYLPGDIFWFLESEDRFNTEPKFFKFFDKNMKYEICSLKDPGALLGYLLHKILLAINKEEKIARYSRSG
jgi:predicted ATP-grasp superfamily ATP-dependent carboligase